LVAPGLEFAIWRDVYLTPDPNTMLGFYEQNTHIHYTCIPCSSQ
jgi:hypothetical protein